MCSWCSVHVASSDKLFHVMHNKKTRFYIIYSEYGGKQYKKEEKTERAKITHCESTSERNAQKRRKIQKKKLLQIFFFFTLYYSICAMFTKCSGKCMFAQSILFYMLMILIWTCVAVRLTEITFYWFNNCKVFTSFYESFLFFEMIKKKILSVLLAKVLKILRKAIF